MEFIFKEDAKHHNIFTHKYAICKGKSKKAKEARRKLEIAKLEFRKRNAKNKLVYALIKKEMDNLLKTKKLEDIKSDEIKNIVDNAKLKVSEKNKNA